MITFDYERGEKCRNFYCVICDQPHIMSDHPETFKICKRANLKHIWTSIAQLRYIHFCPILRVNFFGFSSIEGI